LINRYKNKNTTFTTNIYKIVSVRKTSTGENIITDTVKIKKVKLYTKKPSLSLRKSLKLINSPT
ncbi:hypothetical protein LWG81_19270, partial [Clostridioides difficile]|uniref:hypothetical protein n=3 Tax=Clostridioides difficile TaxID=1496 RepID=UPI001D3F594A